MRKAIVLIAAAAALCLGSIASAQRTFDTDVLAETFAYDENSKRSVELADLHQGCPARDCIPSIDDPKFVAAQDADFVSDDDIVLTLSYEGTHRAYPRRIIDYHEIVNDTVAGTPIAITWCPLCGSGVGVHREIQGTVTEFGVSGVLYNSDLVIYDRATNTLWEQIDAKGIVGPLTDVKLELVPIGFARWGDWKAAHPDTDVMTPDTGMDKPYETERFAEYRQSERIWFPIANNNDRMHPKTVVFGYLVDDTYIAYTQDLLAENGSHTHELNGKTLTASLSDDGTATLVDDSGAAYHPTRLFWFAWYTFHPETELVF